MPIIRWGHEIEIVPVYWLWKPMIPYGKVTIVEGDGGDGKTTMILTIAAMLSQGKTPPSLVRGHLVDETDCESANVFYLTNEDEVADTSLVRYIRAGGVKERFSCSAELQEHMTLTEENLLSAIDQTGCRLIIVDPFQAFLTGGNEPRQHHEDAHNLHLSCERGEENRRSDCVGRAPEQKRRLERYTQRFRKCRYSGERPVDPHGRDEQARPGNALGENHQEQFRRIRLHPDPAGAG